MQEYNLCCRSDLGHLGMCGAGISPVVSVVAGRVLQAEAGLVALGHWVMGAGVQQFVVAELIHAVVVPMDQQHSV